MDIGTSNWNENDIFNTTAAPDGAPEGMAPSGVNDVLRAHQGAVKRWYNWTSPKLTAGSGSAYSLAYSVAPGGYVDGMSFTAEFHASPGAGATLNVNALGVVPIRHFYNGAWYLLPPSWCAAGSILRMVYHASSGVFRVADSVQAIPAGTSQVNRSPTIPMGWLAEDGSAVSRTQYSALFAAIGTIYGAGDGSTTFNLPDSRGYVDAGVGGPLGASLAQKPSTSTTATASTNVSVGVSGTLTGGYAGGLVGDAQGWSGNAFMTASVSIAVSGYLAGSGSGTSAPFNIVQPTIVANKMIKT